MGPEGFGVEASIWNDHRREIRSEESCKNLPSRGVCAVEGLRLAGDAAMVRQFGKSRSRRRLEPITMQSLVSTDLFAAVIFQVKFLVGTMRRPRISLFASPSQPHSVRSYGATRRRGPTSVLL